MAGATPPVVAVFASEHGPGDPERASLMSEFGMVFARRGARIICVGEGGIIPVPLVTAARAAGGAVEIIADDTIVLPPALSGVPITVVPDRAARMAKVTEAASVFVGLPGSLASATTLFGAWSKGTSKPLVLLNRHKAFEVIRGFAADVLAPAVPGYDRKIQFAETVEELWAKVAALDQRR
jgi:predicted Rossmann-fold nucleotide-binding protein